MVEMLAQRYTAPGRQVTADDPYQHHQFAGRADLSVVEPAGPDLLHHEVKTAVPNLGELAGSWNAKRQYLPAALARWFVLRAGFRSVTHVLTIAWTAECLHVARIRGATLRSLGPDDSAAFRAWWERGLPAAGVTSTVVLLDPIERPRAAPWAPLDALGTVRSRHAGYAELLTALREAGRA